MFEACLSYVARDMESVAPSLRRSLAAAFLAALGYARDVGIELGTIRRIERAALHEAVHKQPCGDFRIEIR